MVLNMGPLDWEFSALTTWHCSSFSTTFCVWLFKKNVSHVIFFNWSSFIVWLPSLLEILCICILQLFVCFPGCDVVNFEVNFIFLIKPFFCMTKKSRKKYLENKQLLRWNKTHYSSFLKVFQLPKSFISESVPLRKNCCNCFFILLWCKTFRYFTGFQSCSLLLVLFKNCEWLKTHSNSFSSFSYFWLILLLLGKRLVHRF